mmetsp:Transcript_59701/g.134566  ORF Transcript_59701/g.134566 Transcript_59701/m.134566 type:complete len:201 (+) Transcript_59701:1499-2101(+)
MPKSRRTSVSLPLPPRMFAMMGSIQSQLMSTRSKHRRDLTYCLKTFTGRTSSRPCGETKPLTKDMKTSRVQKIRMVHDIRTVNVVSGGRRSCKGMVTMSCAMRRRPVSSQHRYCQELGDTMKGTRYGTSQVEIQPPSSSSSSDCSSSNRRRCAPEGIRSTVCTEFTLGLNQVSSTWKCGASWPVSSGWVPASESSAGPGQ